MKTYKKPKSILVSMDFSEMIAYSNVTGSGEGIGGGANGNGNLDGNEEDGFFGNSKGSGWDEE